MENQQIVLVTGATGLGHAAYLAKKGLWVIATGRRRGRSRRCSRRLPATVSTPSSSTSRTLPQARAVEVDAITDGAA
jgi:NADP-dependent 3-hydroxy acid dehydrogenase YdfG